MVLAPIRKIITVLTHPDTAALLNRQGGQHHIILSDKLAAKYFTQLAFQKNLEKVYIGLTSGSDPEIKLLDVDVHIPRAALTTKEDVKQLLLTHGLIYLGAVNAQKECQFDTADFADASQIIVIGPRAQ
jgi:hypothetical protein